MKRNPLAGRVGDDEAVFERAGDAAREIFAGPRRKRDGRRGHPFGEPERDDRLLTFLEIHVVPDIVNR